MVRVEVASCERTSGHQTIVVKRLAIPSLPVRQATCQLQQDTNGGVAETDRNRKTCFSIVSVLFMTYLLIGLSTFKVKRLSIGRGQCSKRLKDQNSQEKKLFCELEAHWILIKRKKMQKR